jgi:hypothetical protein
MSSLVLLEFMKQFIESTNPKYNVNIDYHHMKQIIQYLVYSYNECKPFKSHILVCDMNNFHLKFFNDFNGKKTSSRMNISSIELLILIDLYYKKNKSCSEYLKIIYNKNAYEIANICKQNIIKYTNDNESNVFNEDHFNMILNKYYMLKHILTIVVPKEYNLKTIFDFMMSFKEYYLHADRITHSEIFNCIMYLKKIYYDQMKTINLDMVEVLNICANIGIDIEVEEPMQKKQKRSTKQVSKATIIIYNSFKNNTRIQPAVINHILHFIKETLKLSILDSFEMNL